MFLKEVSYVHHVCIYLIKNTVKTVMLWCEILLQFKRMALYFKILYSVIQCDPSEIMLIWFWFMLETVVLL